MKPFNPILGETVQAYFPDGSQMYCEHISHHPPISSFLLEGPTQNYRVSGHLEFKAKISKNTLIMQNDGPQNVDFNDGQRVTFHTPTDKLKGMLFGD